MNACSFGWLSTLIAVAAPAAAQVTMRASLGVGGVQGNHGSSEPSISADGCLVAFRSGASNLVAGDTNAVGDVFVRDLVSGAVLRASVSSTGAQGDDRSLEPVLARDGGTVVFRSFATNLVAGDANAWADVFVHELASGLTERVSVGAGGVEADRESYLASPSNGGRYVVFTSSATNLDPAVANGMPHVYLRDRVSATTTCVSVDANGAPGNSGSSFASISADGRFIAFHTNASNLSPGHGAGIFVRDALAGTLESVDVALGGGAANGSSSWPTSISADGRFVAFVSLAANLVVGDTNASNDVFVRDRAAGSTTRVSVDSLGNQSAGWCYPASISGDGNRVQFHSEGTDLVPNDTNGQIDCFVHELSSGATWRVNVDSAGLPANNGSIGGAMSGDGRYVAFNSSASNLVPNDTNAAPDIFVRDLEPLACGSGAFYCTQSPSSQGCRAQLSTSGVCSASAGSGFVIQADAIDANRQGLFFYSTNGAQVASFNGGKLCAVPPLKRTQQLNSGGSGACGGTFALDFNARIASGVDPALVAGAQFWGQFWYRDPPNVWTTGTTHAVTAILCP